MWVRVSDVSSYFFCPLKVYLCNGLGFRGSVGVEARVGGAVHDLYLTLSRLSGIYVEKGLGVEDAVRKVKRDAFSTVSSRWPDYRDILSGLVEGLVRFRIGNGFAGFPVGSEVYLESERLGLYGRLDLLEGSVPVEVKYKRDVSVGDVYQLVAYGLLLRDVKGLWSDYGFIDLLGSFRRVRVLFTDELVERTRSIIEKVRLASITPIFERRGDCNVCDLRLECKMFFG